MCIRGYTYKFFRLQYTFILLQTSEWKHFLSKELAWSGITYHGLAYHGPIKSLEMVPSWSLHEGKIFWWHVKWPLVSLTNFTHQCMISQCHHTISPGLTFGMLTIESISLEWIHDSKKNMHFPGLPTSNPGIIFSGMSSSKGLIIIWAMTSFNKGKTLRVPSPGPEFERLSQPESILLLFYHI